MRIISVLFKLFGNQWEVDGDPKLQVIPSNHEVRNSTSTTSG